jgi:hypothetical protein
VRAAMPSQIRSGCMPASWSKSLIASAYRG